MQYSNYIIHFIKEYFAIIFYLFIISNIVIRVIITKKSKKKKKKKKSRKGGGILGGIWYVLLCIITFGWSCGIWSGLDDLYQDLEKMKKDATANMNDERKYWNVAPYRWKSWHNSDAMELWQSNNNIL